MRCTCDGTRWTTAVWSKMLSFPRMIYYGTADFHRGCRSNMARIIGRNTTVHSFPNRSPSPTPDSSTNDNFLRLRPSAQRPSEAAMAVTRRSAGQTHSASRSTLTRSPAPNRVSPRLHKPILHADNSLEKLIRNKIAFSSAYAHDCNSRCAMIRLYRLGPRSKSYNCCCPFQK